MKVGAVRGIVNVQMTRQEASELLAALNYAPPGTSLAVLNFESRLIELLYPDGAA